MKFMSINLKLNIAIIGISLVSIFIVFIVLFKYEQNIRTDVYSSTKKDLIESSNRKIASKMRVGITNAISIANDERITKAFKNDNRDCAIKSFTDISKKMKANTAFKNIKIHLHTKDNISFVRNWKPEKYGDDLSSFRDAVVYVNKTKKSLTTFEPGRAGLLLRAITPVLDEQGKHFGSLEFIQGINSVVKSFDKSGIGFLLLMNNKINSNMKTDKNFSFKEEMKFKDYIISQKFINQTFLEDAKTLDMTKLFKNGYIISEKYFYTYNDVKDFKDKKLGIVLLAKPINDVSKVLDEAKTLIYIALFGILAIIPLVSIVIMVSIRKLVIKPLKVFENGLLDFFLFLQGKKDFTQNIKIDTNDEFGVMAKSLEENIAVSARLHEELNSLYNELEEKVEMRTQELTEINKEVQDSIDYASIIQKSFLKSPTIIKEKMQDSFVIWQPRDKVGGDLYIYEESDEGVLIGVIDCTGHSVPGGFMTMLAGSMIKRLSSDYFDNPAKLLSELNKAIKKQLNQDIENPLSDDGLDMGLCYINKSGSILKFAGAKLDLLYFKNKEPHIIKSNKQSIGYNRSKLDYDYTNYEIKINGSESFYLYSDGITDQTGGEKNFPYGNRKFKAFLGNIQDKPMLEQEKVILENLLEYQKDNSRRDDVTLIGFKIKKELN